MKIFEEVNNQSSLKTVVIENVPQDIENGFKSVCSLEGMTIREDLIRYMDSRRGNAESYAVLISNLIQTACEMIEINNDDGEPTTEYVYFQAVNNSVYELLEKVYDYNLNP
ncbi:MAG TPA: hypothetical protein PLI62_12640 [Spirochaetota bacterium]|nr:hypothetical protein [Spirochaetota bacterium]